MNEEKLQWLKEISTTTGISYSGDRTITTDFANELIDYITNYKNNWNELKKWLLDGTKEDNWVQGDMFWKEACKSIINKMQEIEEKNNE